MVFFGIFYLVLAFSPVYPQKTHAWMAIPSMIMKQGLEGIYDMMQGMIMSGLKTQALNMINDQVNVIIGGSSGGQVKFIVDWNDYIYEQPNVTAKIYMNDYISNTTRGRGSSSSYASGSNYMNELAESAKWRINQAGKTPEANYEGDPSEMFASGNFKNLNIFLSGINNPWAYNINVENRYQQQKEKLERMAEIKSIANQGFIGVGEKNGEGAITNPGSMVKESWANVQNLPNLALANANSMAEVITSVVSKMINKSLQQGLSNVQRKVQKNLSTQNSINSRLDSEIRTFGPGARFGN